MTDHALNLFDEMAPEEPGPDLTCVDCQESFQSELAFRLHRKRAHDDNDDAPFI